MWALTYRGTGRLHLIGRGRFNPKNHDMSKLDHIEIPDQSVDRLYRDDPPELVGTLDDLIQYTDEEKLALIDRDTGKAIDKAMHPFVGTEESIGILRDQLVQIINALGLEPTADFARLNKIAIAAVEAAVKKKEALNA